MHFKQWIVATLLAGAASGAWAATSLFNDLTSEVGLAPGLEISDTADPNFNGVTFSAAGAKFGAMTVGNDGRNYIRTTEIDYSSVSFTASVEANLEFGVLFLGLGGGNVGTYGTPDWDVTDSIWMELTATNGGTAWPFDNGAPGANTGNILGAAAGAGIHLVSLDYDAMAKTVQYSVDLGNDGSVDLTSAAFDISSLFTNAEPASVYIGGGDFGADGVELKNLTITIVPEPAALLLLSLGALFALRRR